MSRRSEFSVFPILDEFAMVPANYLQEPPWTEFESRANKSTFE